MHAVCQYDQQGLGQPGLFKEARPSQQDDKQLLHNFLLSHYNFGKLLRTAVQDCINNDAA